MKKTSQFLTDREFHYAKKRFKSLKYSTRLLWPVYILIVLTGLFFIFFDPDIYSFCFGIFLFLIGLIGAIFFKNYSDKTIFEIQNLVFLQRGKLNSRTVSVAGTYVQHYFISDYLLNIPDGIEMYLGELLEKYEGQTVTVHLAVCKQTTGDQVHFFYTPLKIENDLCIDQAIQNHGKHFLRVSTFQLYFYLSKMIFAPVIWFVLTFSATQAFELGDVLFGVAFVIGLMAIFLLFPKYFPYNNKKIEEIVRCS